VVPVVNVTKSVEMADGSEIDIELNVGPTAFSVNASAPMIVEFIDQEVTVRWSSSAIADCVFNTSGQAAGVFSARFHVSVWTKYALVEESSGLVLKQIGRDIASTVVFPGLKGEREDEKNPFWKAIALLVLIPLVSNAVCFTVIPDIIEASFKSQFDTDFSINETIKNVIKLNFGQAIQGDEVHSPNDIGFFGRINPAPTTFQINPMRPIMKASSSQSFATSPMVSGVLWSVESLVESSGNPGTITTTGAYTSPEASTIKGRFTRVRVTATAPDTGYYSSALVTVVVDELSIHPLIETCDVGATVELSAGVLGEGQLQWSIKNAVPGESGELKPSDKPDGDRTYHHGPVVASKTYVIDQIEVKNTRTGGTRSMHVLALQKQPMASIEIVSTDVGQGRVQLKATINGTTVPDDMSTWSLPIAGQGTIDRASGLYRADSSATARFALILFETEIPFFGRAEGHIILPLPLVEFPKLLEIMSK